jgi:hypothetical protein
MAPAVNRKADSRTTAGPGLLAAAHCCNRSWQGPNREQTERREVGQPQVVAILDIVPEDIVPGDSAPGDDIARRDTGFQDAGLLDTEPLDTEPLDTEPLDTGHRDLGYQDFDRQEAADWKAAARGPDAAVARKSSTVAEASAPEHCGSHERECWAESACQ